MEECNTPAKVFDFGMRRLSATLSGLYSLSSHFRCLVLDFPYNSAHILECEYYVLEELNFQLIIYHPYRPLIQYVPRCVPLLPISACLR